MMLLAGRLQSLIGVRTSVRALSTTPVVSKKSNPARGKTRKSPKTLLRLYEQGLLKGAEAARAAALLGKDKKVEVQTGDNELSSELPLSMARRIIRAVDAARPNNAYELHIVTSVPPNQTNAFRGRLVYPRDPRIRGEVVLVFAEQGSEAEEAAQRAAQQLADSGSSTKLIIGGTEMIGEVSSNRISHFTKVLCTTDILPALSRALARTLGPRGLMPSTKRGTAVEDGEEMQRAVEQLVSGVDWRGDRTGVVRGAVGRISFSESELRSNVQALLDAVIAKVASGLAGTRMSPSVIAGYARDEPVGDAAATRNAAAMKRALSVVKQVHLSSTQGPGVRLRLDDIL
ncbi:hypothetical protein MCUN1_003209 [Malassezia cuniculi]|uniref:50S ribosomal protein L1 n=1 Tax=Malassezia cuniculi TaxID=948313 RepID=A0AAF0J7Q7_9BASI|nr:hypothetical protein MCUN1_003209 [Malassezia cuniculi]